MPSSLSILCIHGVGDHHTSLTWEDDWRKAIQSAVSVWDANRQADCQFEIYDDIFQKYPLNPATYGEALFRLGGSGIAVGAQAVEQKVQQIGAGVEQAAAGVLGRIGTIFQPSRGLADIPDQLRWTAGMVAQWADSDALRAETRQRITDAVDRVDPQLILAHSLGTLICYDTFSRQQQLLKGRTLVVFGSQIGNPFVRSEFGGYITALQTADAWYQLYNPDDRAFSAPIQVVADNFHRVVTEFTDGFLNHDAIKYLTDPNASGGMWQQVVTPPSREFRPVTRAFVAYSKAAAVPQRRALLVGINEYPDPQNRLEGCVNDVFRISAALQDSGFDPDDIRVVFDDRATAQGILDRLHWLLDGTCPRHERFFFYSGHGAQLPSYGASGEVDHINDCLVPYDFDWSLPKAIADVQFQALYSQLPYECWFVSIFDCCHSGGIVRNGAARVRGIDPPDDIRHRALRWDSGEQMWVSRKFTPPTHNRELTQGPKRQAYLGDSGASFRLGRAVALRRIPEGEQKQEEKDANHKGPFMPVVLEACQEQELSYEYRDGAASYGAFTYALTLALRQDRTQKSRPSFGQLARETKAKLKRLGYKQTPCLVGPKTRISRPIPWHPSLK